MATPTDIEMLDYGRPQGALARGLHRVVIQGVGATRTLLAKESGALCLFDRAAGVVYTLPTPVEGMFFDFATTVTITTNAARTNTAIATEFLIGAVQLVISGAATTLAASANGTTIRIISSNGTTTGGVIGDQYRVTAISATQWEIRGLISASGILATPFA